MKKIVDLLRTDNRTAQSKQEKDRLTKLLKDIEDLIRRQKQLEAENRLEKTDSKDIADRQGKAAEETDKLARSMGNKDQKGQKSDPGGEAKNEKSQPKDGGKSEGKMGGKSKGEEKPGETKKSEPKEGKDQDGKDAKPGEAKAGKPGDKGPETKPGEAKPGDKGGENKPQAKESPKGAENKPSEPKAGGSETKKGEAKPGDKSQGKSSAKPGQGPDQPPQDPQAKKDNQNTPPSPKGDDSQDDLANSKKRMREAYDAMKQAQKDLEEKKTKPAGDKQVEAIKDLEQVKKDLEDLLRIKREEEMEKLLVQLIDRCQRMLALQKIVLEGTEQVFNSIQANSIKKANDANRQESAKLSEKERDIIGEADRAIELLQGEGSGVAVPEAFHQVREDMKHVWKRLDVTDPGLVTQAIENDIIASLEDMIKALKQAEKKLKDKKDQPPMPPSPPKPPPDQKLLDQIAELKMIRACRCGSITAPKPMAECTRESKPANPTFRENCEVCPSVRTGFSKLPEVLQRGTTSDYFIPIFVPRAGPAPCGNSVGAGSSEKDDRHLRHAGGP